MPKRSAAFLSEGLASSDDNERHPSNIQSKKPKISKSSSALPELNRAPKTDENGDTFWELNAKGTRRVTISEFKGRNMVNLREYYEKDGTMLPGKKGISLVMEQFSAFLEAVPQIDAILRAKGEHIPRPDYEGSGSATTYKAMGKDSHNANESDANDGEKHNAKKAKANYEDTSEEDAVAG